jgi:RNA polymerase sigma-70 factor (ECF subfamily)
MLAPARGIQGPDDGRQAGEQALVARARQGDPSALEEIVRGHASSVYRIVAGHLGQDEAEDATQEAFVHVQRGLATFEGRARLSTWIHRVATNVALKRLRTRRRKPAPEALVAEPLAGGAGPDAASAAREERAALLAALDHLPEPQRAVVVLRAIEGLSFEEVARTLGIPVPTAESRMARAREKLRVLLRPHLRTEEPRP